MNTRVLTRGALATVGVLLILGTCGGAFTAATAWAAAAQEIAATAPPGSKTIWTGVFSDAQALRGEKPYVEKCAYCHRADLSGGEIGRPLKGVPFLIRWEGKLGNLYFKIGNTMPQDKPATLEPGEVTDILGFILKMNGVPSGTAELTPDPSLETIFVTRDAPAP